MVVHCFDCFRDPMIHLGTATRVCFVKFTDPSSVHVAQHLTNTVFIDRALIVVPVQDGKFRFTPDLLRKCHQMGHSTFYLHPLNNLITCIRKQ